MFQKSALPPTSSGKNKKTEEKADNQSDFVKRDLTMVSRPSLAATISSLGLLRQLHPTRSNETIQQSTSISHEFKGKKSSPSKNNMPHLRPES
jgi:hypothetical protein